MAAARLLPARLRDGSSARAGRDRGRAAPRADASAAAAAAFLARGEPVVVEGGADACVAARGAWTPAALAASLGAKSAPLKAADAPFSEESWAGLGTKGQLPLGAFLERPDQGLYLHDWSLPQNAPEALLDELRTPRWLRGDLLRRCGDDVPYAGAWPSLFVGAPGTRSTCHVDARVAALRHGPRPRRREEVARLAARGRGLPVPSLRRLGGRRAVRRRDSGRGAHRAGSSARNR